MSKQKFEIAVYPTYGEGQLVGTGSLIKHDFHPDDPTHWEGGISLEGYGISLSSADIVGEESTVESHDGQKYTVLSLSTPSHEPKVALRLIRNEWYGTSWAGGLVQGAGEEKFVICTAVLWVA